MARSSTGSASQTQGGQSASQGGSVAGEAPSVIEQAQEATGQVQETVTKLGDTLRGQLLSRIGDQKEKVAGTLETMSLALRTAGSEVRQQNNAVVAQAIEGAATRLETLSGSLRENDADVLTQKVEQVARQRPTLFLASTLGVGLLASRLFKTSSRKQAEREQERARREAERQRKLQEEQELQRQADARSAQREAASTAATADVTRDSELGGYRADELGTVYGAENLGGVPTAPGYGSEAAGLVDEDALTSALLDPTGLGTGTVDAPYDVETEVHGTTNPGRERS